MFVNVRSITKQIGNIVVKAYNAILPKMQIVSSGHEPSILHKRHLTTFRHLVVRHLYENEDILVSLLIASA